MENVDPRKKIKFNPYVLVILSFLIVILIGSILLALPFTHKPGADCGNYLDALVTAVSATCVTGITTYKNGVLGSLNFAG